ncbi:hypothetical protein [Sorangium sp. So ce406]|uniref:hypothetical protein n=1 Tax=Sorangium sp. So ce406 TaxID=3133311 RepID=UPI003F5BA36D
MEAMLEQAPTTKYQAMTSLFWMLARHACVDPPLTQLSRALQRADSFAHGVLLQLTDRRAHPHGRRSAQGVDFRPVLQWFHPGGPGRARDALDRFRQRSSTLSTPVEAFEGFVCFHIAMASSDAPGRMSLVEEVFARVAEAPEGSDRRRWLKALLQHAMTDFSLSLHEELLSPAVAACYEPADYLFTVATGLVASRAPLDPLRPRLRSLREASVAQFVLAVFQLVVRLGALPGLAHDARWLLDLAEREHADVLRRIPAQACAEYAMPWDYGADLAERLRLRGEEHLDVLPLFRWALSLVSGGKVRRRRGAEMGVWTVDDARAASRRFTAWGLAHECCRLMAPTFDVRNERCELASDIAKLAQVMSRTPLTYAIGDVVLNELFPMPLAFQHR